MSGWIFVAVFAVVVWLLLWRPGGLGRPALTLAAAALFVAAAGYAWQGTPGEAGAPAARHDQNRRPDTLFAIDRQSLLPHFGETAQWLGEADAMNRWGDDRAAAEIMQSAVSKHPDNVALRLGLAHALLVLADGNITAPAVKLAYERAIALAGPDDPSARYFYGLAWLEAGGVDQAGEIWRKLEASLPADSPWRQVLEGRLKLIGMIQAQQARMAASG